MAIKYDPILGALRETDSATSGGGSGGRPIVEVPSLPESGAEGVIYRVPAENPTAENRFTEYYWTGSAWEKFGQPGTSGGTSWNEDETTSGLEWLE
ncbi:MAG: hypothetical protein V8T86_07600 [Victivallis sp.]